jgi:hypothetical protein
MVGPVGDRVRHVVGTKLGFGGASCMGIHHNIKRLIKRGAELGAVEA